ncbi:hypothetical protein [Ktedonospora formicarum]|uniref:Uncharacterized protein n=1 Tax=Ktedonospora formicarum TaxID=2778364 RepID=A0A8J3I772_9CHLR|nr:hypothetical protein [Ktedonospora formicarum]GHO50819.1 hypothetical protein KSX_89820 [Ktedonospora formicarum]
MTTTKEFTAERTMVFQGSDSLNALATDLANKIKDVSYPARLCTVFFINGGCFGGANNQECNDEGTLKDTIAENVTVMAALMEHDGAPSIEMDFKMEARVHSD